MGIREKNPAGNEIERYRLVWDDITFEPGEITVRAYDDAGNVTMSETIRTAGTPAKLELLADREVYTADGDDLCYVTVRVLDAEGNFCPKAATRLHFEAAGCGEFLASDNGDQTDTEVFPSAYRNAFSGMAVGIFRTKCGCSGELRIRVEADGMEPAMLTVKVK
jgi:beta-galactosidase